MARALITAPELILADEPTGALDSRASARLLELFEAINREGQTIVMVTHSVEAASHAGRVLFLRDGRVYHQLFREGESREHQVRRISDVLTGLTQGGSRMREYSFFPRLALVNLTRNRRFYGPYLISCGGTVGMYYVLRFLAGTETLASVRGAAYLQSMMSIGCAVVGIFAAVIFALCQQFRHETAASGARALSRVGAGKETSGLGDALGDAVLCAGGLGIGTGSGRVLSIWCRRCCWE